MNQRSLSTVLFKVLGIFSIIRAMDYASPFLWTILSKDFPTSQLFSMETARALPALLAVPVLYLVIAFILLRYANKVAARMFPDNSSAIPEDARPRDEWYVLPLTVVGVVLLVWTVPASVATCLYNFAWPVMAKDAPAALQRDMRPYAWKALLRAVMQVGLGLYLVLGARGIIACVRKLRRD